MKASRRIVALLIPAVLAACASPSPQIKSVVAAQPGDPSKALLDLRGLSGVQAYENGVQLDSNTALPPGRHTLHFSFDAVYAQTDRCMPGGGGGMGSLGAEAIIVLPLAIVIGGAIALTCQAASSAQERPRACYTLSLNAKGGDVYVPRAVGNKPVLVESRTGRTVSTTTNMPCFSVDKRNQEANERRRKVAEVEEHKRLLRNAKQGDGAAMYQMYERSRSRNKRLTWLCLAAHGGHVEARVRFAALYNAHDNGSYFRHFEPMIRDDPLEAWKWYRLAVMSAKVQPHKTEFAGYPEAAAEMATTIERQLSPEKQALGNRLVETFRPTPNSCRKKHWPLVQEAVAARSQAKMETKKRTKAAPKRDDSKAKRTDENHRRQAARPKASTVDRSGALVAKPTQESAAGTGSGPALKALFSGARLYLRRAGDWRDVVYLVNFHESGSVSGTGTDSTGSFEASDVSGRWWVRDDRLCTQLSIDANKTECYVITGSNRHYSASGAAGLLAGQFRLTK